MILQRFCSAQQAFETLKLTFGDNKCFLVQINSQQTPSTNDIIDPWLKFLRRQPKMVSSCQLTNTFPNQHQYHLFDAIRMTYRKRAVHQKHRKM